jgi:hypothetical protein
MDSENFVTCKSWSNISSNRTEPYSGKLSKEQKGLKFRIVIFILGQNDKDLAIELIFS